MLTAAQRWQSKVCRWNVAQSACAGCMVCAVGGHMEAGLIRGDMFGWCFWCAQSMDSPRWNGRLQLVAMCAYFAAVLRCRS